MGYYFTDFVCDIRKKDGSQYPPKSGYYLVGGLLGYLHDKRHVKFTNFRGGTLDSKLKKKYLYCPKDPNNQENEGLLWGKIYWETNVWKL